jgi:nucleoside-diphosphate-sugar epimerase
VAVLITGATGLVGGHVLETARRRGLSTVAGVRGSRLPAHLGPSCLLGDISGQSDFSAALEGCRAVIHCAARAHILKETAVDPDKEFRTVNVDATLALGEQAAACGVKRFLFVSSIGVNGAQCDRPFVPEDPPAPVEPYARSKLAAEQGLQAIAARTGMELVVVRPVLVYGPGCRGNFARLMKLVASGIPLPFGRIEGTRSLIGVWNLADLLVSCVDAKDIAGRTLLAADGEDIALPSLLLTLGEGMGRRVRLVNVDPALLRSVAALIGRRSTYEKLVGSLRVDMTETKRLLDWEPIVSLHDGLLRTAASYNEEMARERRAQG